jgi:hypothetical protein
MIGGGNGSLERWCEVKPQKLADESGLEILVCRLPPGTRGWNKIEHCLFSRVSQDRRDIPLISRQIIAFGLAALLNLTIRREFKIFGRLKLQFLS